MRELEDAVRAAVSIQAAMRCIAAKQLLRIAVDSAVRIQCTFRMATPRVSFLCYRSSAITLQSNWRCVKLQSNFKGIVSGATKIENFWRTVTAVRSKIRIVNAAVKIQGQWRCLMDYASFNKVKNAQLIILKWWIAVLVQRAREIHSVVILQSLCRRFLTQRCFKTNYSAALIIQRFCLRYVKFLAHTERELFLLLRQRIVALQRRLRARWNIRKVENATAMLQRITRGLIGRTHARKMMNTIVQLQARQRGKMVRFRTNRNRRIMAVRAKMAAAAARAAANPELRLGNRTKAALDVLQNAKMLTHVLKACKNLEISTRLSPPCCSAFANGGATGILFKLVRTCNRSPPHQELLQSILRTLNFVAMRGEEFCRNMIQIGDITPESAVEVISDLIQNFRDKEPIFCLAVGLLCQLSTASTCVSLACASADVQKRLNGVVGIVSRKLMLFKKDKVNDGGAICSGGDNGKRCHGALPSNLLDGCTQLGRLLKSL